MPSRPPKLPAQHHIQSLLSCGGRGNCMLMLPSNMEEDGSFFSKAGGRVIKGLRRGRKGGRGGGGGGGGRGGGGRLRVGSGVSVLPFTVKGNTVKRKCISDDNWINYN